MSTPVKGESGFPPRGMEAVSGGEGIVPSSSALLMDPAALARVVEVAAAQIAAHASPRPAAPPISEATVQLTLRLPDGEYVGDVRNGQPHGRGTMRYDPGLARRRYEGEWQEDEFHGRGALVCSNENRYEGQWQNGLFHGRGTFTQGDGSRKYEGEWQFGYQHGVGKMHIDSDGKSYGPEVVKNHCAGENGSLHVGKGQRMTEYQGEYVSGFPHGHGEERKYDGGVFDSEYNGEFRNGGRHGNGSGRSGDFYQSGHFDKNVLGGQGSSSYNGNRKEGVFRNGDLWSGVDHFTHFDESGTFDVRDGVRQLKTDVGCRILKCLCCILSLGMCYSREAYHIYI